MKLLPAELIKAKRRGERHSQEEIFALIANYTNGSLADYQMSAWLMAVCFQGLSPEETAWLTEAMTNSGERLNFSGLSSTPVDKHSTGGVGDKVSLVLGSLVASAGVPVPMMAGRGLGHTGGSLDKIESLKGFNVWLGLDEFKKQVEEIGVALVGQTKEICPADKKLYALRDVTGTVDSIPLICASIMSKKIAEGIGGLVLDVKFGSGAFMKTLAEAESLAKELCRVGQLNNLKVIALLTSMEQPLGAFVGNRVEVYEALKILKAEPHIIAGRDALSEVRELTLELAAYMIHLSRPEVSLAQAKNTAEGLLRSGAALEKFVQMCRRQGASDPLAIQLPPIQGEVHAEDAGFVTSIQTEQVGLATIAMGAGRRTQDEAIDHSAGIEVLCRLGDKVVAGQPLFRLYGERPFSSGAFDSLKATVNICASPTPYSPLIAQIIGT